MLEQQFGINPENMRGKLPENAQQIYFFNNSAQNAKQMEFVKLLKFQQKKII